MASSVQDILRILHAAAGYIPGGNDASFYVAVEESNELSEQRWVGSQLASETLIASGIRTNSPAVYNAHDDTRSVFCVGEDNALRLFTLEEEEWHEDRLSGSQRILVHPSGRLSGSGYDGDCLVFFEGMNRRLRGIRVQKDGSWEYLRSFSVDSAPGNPHFAQVQGETVYLSYVRHDDYVSQLGMGITSNFSNDRRLPDEGPPDAHITNLIVSVHDEVGNAVREGTQNESRDEPEYYLLALTKKEGEMDEELVCIDGNGKRTLMGTVVDGVFEPTSDEEGNRPVIKSASTAVGNATGPKGGTRGKRRRR